MSHTPGPWSVTIPTKEYRVPYVDSAKGFVAAMFGLDGAETANATLIAAAPDLLEALKAMVERWEPDSAGADRRMWENACAALEKATSAARSES